MANIITREEVKSILGITGSTYDTQIDTLIPLVSQDVLDYLNNYFPDKNTRYSSRNFILIAGSPPQITDTEEERFLIEGFEGGMDIAVEGTYRNRGIYTISTSTGSTITASVITLTTNDTLYNEESTAEYGGNNIRITRVVYPRGLKIYISQIIWLNVKRSLDSDVKSRSLGPSAVTYESIEGGGYSPAIMNGLAKYKKAVII